MARANLVRALRRLGIESVVDLDKFDHRRFWADRLRLVHISPERLGLIIRNRQDGTKSRVATSLVGASDLTRPASGISPPPCFNPNADFCSSAHILRRSAHGGYAAFASTGINFCKNPASDIIFRNRLQLQVDCRDAA